MGSYSERQRVDRKEVFRVNHIAEACAELALYKVMISIDDILDHYSEPALAAMDIELWIFLENMQASGVLTKEAMRRRKA
ncbi:hypothetical protein Ngar_c02280 [Candidatus Nitrososphaera gargensis Ga9.2]|uniref:Uncharacterized protein n=1 Tax=Nitrososphaera gargensis (strain Ga9.2) TaxID=1237085 RepID=K0I7G9_NITGG|nr:hypothetical protein [Candidatus Nitrososphaera gargensis]AFU57176.1 hypothetical protein Ngar_c02280 [Candidatus Nitrososphaera gargensis Ga9.2]